MMDEQPKCAQCGGAGIVYDKEGNSRTCLECLNSGKLDSFRAKQEQEEEKPTACPKCHGRGIVKDANGSSHCCWDCLTSGRLDNHSKNLPDSDIKI
jgi:DnaJ-class molecular chaperone